MFIFKRTATAAFNQAKQAQALCSKHQKNLVTKQDLSITKESQRKKNTYINI